MNYVDLTFKIEQGMPYFKGDPKPEINQFKSIKKDGYNLKEIHIGTHTGTHIDAPAHFIEGGRTIDSYDPLYFSGFGTAVEYEPGRLELAGKKYDFVYLYTGYNRDWEKKGIFKDFTYIDKDDAEKLKDAKIKFVGIDSPSAEAEGQLDFPTHHILLGAGIPIIENLNSRELEKLLGKVFFTIAIPIPIGDGDGAPARVIAIEV